MPSLKAMKGGPGGPADVSMQFDSRLREVMASVRANMGAMLEAMGDDIVGIAKALAPVDEGELRDSIEYTGGMGRLSAAARAPHAAHVEFGTATQAARPYMIPAFRFAKSNFREGIGRKGILGAVSAEVRPYRGGGNNRGGA